MTTSPAAFIERVRIDLARCLLVETRQRIDTVAQAAEAAPEVLDGGEQVEQLLLGPGAGPEAKKRSRAPSLLGALGWTRNGLRNEDVYNVS